MKKILFVCTSNADRSPALEKYFREFYPEHKYKSAGINNFHCARKGNHYIEQADIDWADVLIFCEQIHQEIVFRNFSFYDEANPTKKKSGLILGLGEYEKGNINDNYLLKAKDKLKTILES